MPAPTMHPGVFDTTTFNALAQYVDDTRAGILARGRRTTTSSTTTTEVGVLLINDVPISAGKLIKVWTSPLFLGTTVNNDVVRVSVRYTTDGSTPTTSSTQMCAAQTRIDNATFPPTEQLTITYSPASNETLSILLTVSRQTGTGNVSITNSPTFDLDLVIEDVGVDSGDVGVDI